jgi:capsular polysaccharide biosynthesis protein
LAEPSPPLRQYLRFARRQGWLIVFVPVLAVAIAALVVQRQPSVHRASMGIVVAETSVRFQPPVGSQSLAQTMKSILRSDVLARRVVQDLDLPISSSELSNDLRVELLPDTSVLNVSYDSTDKGTALTILSEVEAGFQRIAREELGVSTSLQRPGPLGIVASVYDPPHLQADRVSPRPKQVLGFAGVLGLALGLIFAFARESLDDRIRSRGEAEEAFGARVIGTLPRHLRAQPSTRGPAQPRREAEEALQALRANVEDAAARAGPTFLVTSALDRMKPASVVANLGVALALDGHYVICIDADVRRPILHRLLGVPEPTRGLLSVVDDGTAVGSALEEVELVAPSNNSSANAAQERPRGRLMLLPVGAGPSDASAVVTSQRLLEIVEELSAKSTYVLIHSPSLLSPPNGAASIAPNVDSVLVVARQGRTRREWAEKVRLTLKTLGTRRVALVLTDVSSPLFDSGHWLTSADRH